MTSLQKIAPLQTSLSDLLLSDRIVVAAPGDSTASRKQKREFLLSKRMDCPSKSLTLYVNSNSTSVHQTGLSWQHAFSDLQSALEVAGDACGKVYILIAKGVYIPSVPYAVNDTPQSTERQSSTFHIPNNTYLIGGFSGKESSRKDSCPADNKTVLSGRKYYTNVVRVGNEGSSIPNNTSSAISNLTVSGSSGTTPGGGVRVEPGANLKLENVNITSNFGTVGGGLYVDRGKVLVTDCVFSNNSASETGGAIFITGTDASVMIKRSKFTGNIARTTGGVIAGTSKITVEGCDFEDNIAEFAGCIGAIEQSTLSIDNSNFKNNLAIVSGGAVVVAGKASIESSVFDYNTCMGSPFEPDANAIGGGAILVTSDGEANIYDVTFTHNITQKGNGGALLNNTKTSIAYSKFGGNKTLFGNGGAIASIGGNNTTLNVTDTVFKNNKAVNGLDDNVYVKNTEE